jgi:hypothetical protein
MIPIIASPSAPYATVRTNAQAVPCADWYLRALVALWDAGLATGVDPVVLAAQCAHETGWGRFGGAVTPAYGNTAGMKTRAATGDTAADLAQFAVDRDGYPRLGALAQAHHLRLYCGFPAPPDSPDERAVYTGPGTALYGSAGYVEDLGGKWAPAADYGLRIAAIVQRLRGF